jgi:hypothetical protein
VGIVGHFLPGLVNERPEADRRIAQGGEEAGRSEGKGGDGLNEEQESINSSLLPASPPPRLPLNPLL